MSDKTDEPIKKNVERSVEQMEEKKDAGAQGYGSCGFVAPVCATNAHIWDNFRH